jgi:nitrite reductase/ring-hydroxylating ferredoxin subunit
MRQRPFGWRHSPAACPRRSEQSRRRSSAPRVAAFRGSRRRVFGVWLIPVLQTYPGSEVPVGTVKIVELAGRSIGVFNAHGVFYALRNRCPHNGGPLCSGRILGLASSDTPGEYVYERQGEIVRCAWHGWEFDITNGRSVFDPFTTRVRSYPVEIERTRYGNSQNDDGTLQAETYPVEVDEDVVVVILD